MSPAEFLPGSEFFERLSPSPGPLEDRTITVGPFGVRLEEIPQHLLPPLDDHFQGFIAREGAGQLDLRMPVRRAGVPSFLDSRDGAPRACLQRLEEGRLLIYGHTFASWFERTGTAGMMAVCRAGWMGLRVALEIFLRVYCAWRAMDRGGLLLHAASIVRDDRAYVFFGHSGAGKTTVSRLSSENGFVLSDDITVITFEGNAYHAHSVPLRGYDKGRIVSERRTYPVAGLYQLVKARHNRAQPLDRPVAAAAVLSCMPFVTDDLLPLDPARTMEHVAGIVRRIPVFRLEFTRSADFWEPVLASVR